MIRGTIRGTILAWFMARTRRCSDALEADILYLSVKAWDAADYPISPNNSDGIGATY